MEQAKSGYRIFFAPLRSTSEVSLETTVADLFSSSVGGRQNDAALDVSQHLILYQIRQGNSTANLRFTQKL